MNVEENEVTTNVVVNYTGNITFFRSVTYYITCHLNMTYFPFDRQVRMNLIRVEKSLESSHKVP